MTCKKDEKIENAEPTETPAPAPAPETIDPAQIREQLGLAADAPDAEVIAGLLMVVATLSQKYETLLAEAAGNDADVANRTLAEYADRIPAGTEDFWRDSLLTNRADTIAALEAMQPPAPAATPAPAPTPLANRIQAPNRDPNPAATAPTPADSARAATITNRAHEIMREQRIPFTRAFAKAQAETK